MKFLTGDDTGILKQVKVEAQKVERLGPQRQGDAIERLCWSGPAEDRESRVAVAYASGLLESRDSATGKVLSSARASPSVKCLQVYGTGLLAVSADGCGGIVREWCGDACPEGGEEGADCPAYAGVPTPATASSEAVAKEGSTAGPWLRRFSLQGPVAEACTDPSRPHLLAFGGEDNDVKVFDLEKGEVTWRAKNVRENSLCLRVAIRVSTLSWATELAPARSLLIYGTTDGKVRLYDVATQRRPLFELSIGHGTGKGSGGHTGAADDAVRPLNCSVVAHAAVRGGGSARASGKGWSLFLGDTVGTLREYDLRNLPTCQAAEVSPGRKKHSSWAAKQMPFRRGYKGIMGSIRSLDVHASGEAVVAVGLGRFAYIFETAKRSRASMVGKVYLKQKLCSVLFSSEERAGPKDAHDSDEGSDANGDGPDAADGPDDDEVQEGFSDDEDADADPEEEAAPQQKATKKKKLKRKRASAEVEAKDGAQEAPESAPPAGLRQKKKRKVLSK